jgi:hypothetical protein
VAKNEPRQILHRCGADLVAEVTGRSRRIVKGL